MGIRTNRALRHTSGQDVRQGGFTLLEVMLVLSILIFIAAMVYPAAGLLNDRERSRVTQERMEEIRRALLGDPDRFDEFGLRIIGGYVGDMEAWPDLFEAAPEVKQNVAGTPPDFDPTNANNPNYYYYRPGGRFVAGRWRWNTPYRRLTDDTTYNYDHIGGLETENEGQPLGLWTDNPYGNGTLLDGSRWRGPYLVTPKDHKPEDAEHWASNDTDYQALEPAWGTGPSESWEDGDYAPVDSDPGEYHDEKEQFRLRQTDDRLEDGWGRALRFFVTVDTAHAGETIFWILSEGPDATATYPNKGTCGTSSWTVDASDTMGRAYDATAQGNADNIVMQISSREWRTILEQRNQRRRQQTEQLLQAIRRALVGSGLPAENGVNNGLTGAICRWPRLFRWEGSNWDNQDASNVAYTKGQPRELWTGSPNSADSADSPAVPSWSLSTAWSGPGIGWSGPYLSPPLGTGATELLLDAWGREILFFYDATHDSLLVLSRGADGRFDFGDTGGAYQEPATPTEAMDNTSYTANDAGGYNADNVVLVLPRASWRPAWFSLGSLTVLNATSGVTKAMFVRGADIVGGLPQTSILTAGTLSDEDLDGSADDWLAGGPVPGQAFHYDDGTAAQACAGARKLVLWQDSNGNNLIDSGEQQATVIYNLLTNNSLEPRAKPVADTAVHFSVVP